jgi:site-specific recombinase XerD
MLLRATSQVQQSPGCSIDVQTFRTLLLFLYGTGALISESRKILLKDVDLKNKTMTIRGGRFDRVRTIPIGFDLHRMLARYIAFRKSLGNRASPELFTNKCGRPLQIRTVYNTFKRIRRFAGLEPSGIPNPPRMHDLRNAFVVHRLSAWYKTGADLRRMIPALSAYIGQVSLSATERYLRLTPERFRHQLDTLSPRRGRQKWGENTRLMKFLAQI